ncbi:type II toxin-antitoxin system HipA family toxin [Pseudomonas gingeri]|uniref:Type II toxin-antitoxin system HipA family toxin n=1 Tax=Pseudomonas gingeri TaxID=117681 RepID=A0A7Y7WUQ4_9PSED|nr:type II toxin-antitoxin system HipA family toxin [Pseudomonas gingeri]NWB88061.1 type II toxin-antitoxin system HipA family toxin [Pseudomonas gingeri]
MKLSVHVLGREVATLEQIGDFKSVLSYHTDVAKHDFVSLTMPVRTESYLWEDPLHPIFQMNLPEGYLLQVLQEQFGPHIGANPTALLSVIGRNMVGRLQVAAPGATLNEPAQPIEVSQLLQGDNSEEAFAELVRRHATSGVSGVVPKFLDSEVEKSELGPHKKGTLLTRRHLIKGSSSQLPYAAMNEHLCMQVAAKVIPTAKTEISLDGKALVVHRFDVDENGHPYWGMEDFCCLLGLRPAAKYDTTWERIAKAVRDHVPGPARLETFQQLAASLLLTYALRNADCHAKNLALRYTTREDVHLAPAYDWLTTSVYAGYERNPPAISFAGKKTWAPGKNLQKFIATSLGIPARQQGLMVEQISDAISDTASAVREAMSSHPQFAEIGKRMLLAWNEGVMGLHDKKVFSVSDWTAGEAFAGLSAPAKRSTPKEVIGRSELLGKR